jgi:hypothetical protein
MNNMLIIIKFMVKHIISLSISLYIWYNIFCMKEDNYEF